ncbi:galactose oxidase [Rhizophagus irregularis]|uniref:Galactose oxidase n=1 Tax=Rhizophagus irregularis TaxID=588596 RepID=A0A2I1GRK9_9GLOM|nr:galactose oxidase [Rhizophagus irregularis]
MYKSLKHHNYHLILIIILCILNVYGQYVPENRYGHSAVYVRSERRIYFIGGFKVTPYVPNPMSDVFYLNVNSTDVEFTDLTSQVNLPLTLFHDSELGGVNKDLIFIVGGVNWNDPDTNYVYSLNTKTNELSVPIVQGKVPPPRKGISSVIYEGKFYLFGGQAATAGVNDALYFNDFIIFDTINLNWQVGSLVNSPTARILHSATIVNGVIYYIGGKTQVNVYPPLTEIYQYDIVGNTWSLKKATAADPKFMPGPRAGHTSILMDGKIVIYGGYFSSGDIQYKLPAKETIAILDVNTLVWSIPEFDARIDNPIPKLFLHTATEMGEIMVIAFGNFTDKPDGFDQTNKEIYMFVFGYPQIFSTLMKNSANEAQPQIPTSTNTNINPQQPSSLSKVVIVGISIGSVSLVLTILSVLSIAHYKRTKKSKVQLGGVPNDPNSVEINDDKSHSEYQQQDPPTILTESP